MKLVMDEKLKHRLIGVAVIISLGAIFAPAVMKKSSQRLENNFRVNVKLPPKPAAPEVVLKDEKELFKTIKIAQVKLPAVSEERQVSELVKAEPLKIEPVVDKARSPAVAQAAPIVPSAPVPSVLKESANKIARKTVRVAVAQVKKNPTIALRQKPKPRYSVAAIKKVRYAVQLASFSQLTNAQALVGRLRSKGYKANFIKISQQQGAIYKVYVGSSSNRVDALKLKSQLATAMQLSGFIVNTGVS